jgi:hypothetical protein
MSNRAGLRCRARRRFGRGARPPAARQIRVAGMLHLVVASGSRAISNSLSAWCSSWSPRDPSGRPVKPSVSPGADDDKLGRRGDTLRTSAGWPAATTVATAFSKDDADGVVRRPGAVHSDHDRAAGDVRTPPHDADGSGGWGRHLLAHRPSRRLANPPRPRLPTTTRLFAELPASIGPAELAGSRSASADLGGHA